MRIKTTLLTFCFLLPTFALADRANDLTLRAEGPAEKWDLAYPVGSGRLGAMPWGTYPAEKILINEETIWANAGEMKIREDAFEHLETIRELDAEGKYYEADRYFEKHIQDGKRTNSYQLVGWLKLDYPDETPRKAVQRELDLHSGIATNRYTLEDGTIITQQVLAHCAAQGGWCAQTG